MADDKRVCVKCGRSDEQTPLITLSFKGGAKYICSQCLPMLIHKTHLLVDQFPGIELPTNEDAASS